MHPSRALGSFAAVLAAAFAVASSAGAADAEDGVDLQVVAVTASKDRVAVGEALTYGVQVRNGSSADVGDVTVTLRFGAGLAPGATPPGYTCQAAADTVACIVPSLAPDDSAVLTYGAVAQAGGDTSVDASVAGTGADPDPSNNTATARTAVDPAPEPEPTPTPTPEPTPTPTPEPTPTPTLEPTPTATPTPTPSPTPTPTPTATPSPTPTPTPQASPSPSPTPDAKDPDKSPEPPSKEETDFQSLPPAAAPGRPSGGAAPPAPIVRFVGRLTARGAQLTRVTVQTVPLVHIRMRCSGPGCRIKERSVLVADAPRRMRTVRLRRLEGVYRAGARLEVSVQRRGFAGKHTTYVIRGVNTPRRRDACIAAGARRPRPC